MVTKDDVTIGYECVASVAGNQLDAVLTAGSEARSTLPGLIDLDSDTDHLDVTAYVSSEGVINRYKVVERNFIGEAICVTTLGARSDQSPRKLC